MQNHETKLFTSTEKKGIREKPRGAQHLKNNGVIFPARDYARALILLR